MPKAPASAGARELQVPALPTQARAGHGGRGVMTVLSAEPFAATELPRVFWTVSGQFEIHHETCKFGAIVELPNGMHAKVERVAYLGQDGRGHYFMGFVTEMGFLADML